MEKLLILDSNSLINRAYYALPNFSNRKGQFTGAIFGYCNMLLKLIENYKPTYIIATFDRKAPTFRKEIYDGYKATRKPMPPELAMQIQPMKEILSLMNIPILEKDGYEADDIIGTIAKKFPQQTYIVTGDKDSLQLVDDSTTVLLTRKGVTEIEEFDVAHLLETGLRPSQVIDLKSLMGDTSDNIPGVPGVGEKTARDLLLKYDTLDGVYEHIEEIKGKLKEKLENNKELAYLSYKLATINTNSPIEIDLLDATLKMPFDVKLKDKLKELELYKIIERLDFDGTSQEIVVEQVNVSTISQSDELDLLVKKIQKEKNFSISLGEDILIATSNKDAYKIQISNNLLDGMLIDYVYLALKPVFEDNAITKIVFDSKTLMRELHNYHIRLSMPYEDVLIKAYLLDANRNYKTLEDLLRSFSIESDSIAAALFSVDKQITINLKERNLYDLYENMELPLVEVLFDMETEGFRVNKEKILEISTIFKKEIEDISNQIFDCTGEVFNINSPKQLSVILFEKIGLKPGGKEAKAGHSTAVDVLQGLINDHPCISLILRYRELEKLRSTYLDGMLPNIDGDGKIRTIFKQTVTATGRLSSTEPNLQNIPVRKKEGKQIRELFIASEGRKLVCADYSQIELRLMAAFSGDESLINAFNNNEDIHALTAAKVFNIPLEMVTPDLRRQAKAVNFGIIYGISSFGLSTDLGIPIYQAKEFIDNYFRTYPKVYEYMEKLKKDAKAHGFAKTYFGRIRYIPELTMSNRNMQMFGERVAMNMPLQGSASDIIKLAMIKVHKALKDNNLKSKLIMQVHDELIIDTYEDEIEIVSKILKENMENVVSLPVKLVADLGVGDSWLEAK
ncbi:MAG: DNA polymerase I [Christensenella sp.]|nr:DNA polymerase I [Christensenella sp.]